MTYLTKFFAILLFTVARTASAETMAGVTPPLQASCGGLGSPSRVVLSDFILRDRYPSIDKLKAPQPCLASAAGLVEQWRRDDLHDWKQLVNRACSAELGWVEKVPGTCQAGGPPPVCTADHWVRAPDAARQKFLELNAKIKLDRENKLIADSCACWKRFLEAESVNPAKARQTLKESRTPRGRLTRPREEFMISCAEDAGMCPPGFECINETCHVEGTPGLVTKRAKKAPWDATKLILKWLAKAVPIVGKRGLPWAVGLIEPAPDTPGLERYQSSVSRIEDLLSDARRKAVAQSEALTSGQRHQADTLGKELTAIVEKLQAERALLDVTTREIVIERGLCRYCCYDVFQYQSARISGYLGELAAGFDSLGMGGDLPLTPLP